MISRIISQFINRTVTESEPESRAENEGQAISRRGLIGGLMTKTTAAAAAAAGLALVSSQKDAEAHFVYPTCSTTAGLVLSGRAPHRHCQYYSQYTCYYQFFDEQTWWNPRNNTFCSTLHNTYNTWQTCRCPHT